MEFSIMMLAFMENPLIVGDLGDFKYFEQLIVGAEREKYWSRK